MVAAGRVRVRRRDPEDGGREVPEDGAPRDVCEAFGTGVLNTSSARHWPATALVTGGASGIGAAAVALLAGERVEVEMLDLATGFDVGDPGAWESVGPVDFAFLNAGVATGESDVAALSDEAYRRAVRANVDGVVFGVRRMARVMAPGSAIVATASLAGVTPMTLDPVYTLTKHAVVGFVRSAAPQLAERGIRINALCPGFSDTPIVGPELREWVADQGWPLIPPGRVAEAALATARSDETGQAWVVQPGREPVVYEFRGVPGPR